MRPLRNPVAAVDASSKNRPAGGANRQQRRFLQLGMSPVGMSTGPVRSNRSSQQDNLASEPRILSTSGEVVLFLDTLCSAHAI